MKDDLFIIEEDGKSNVYRVPGSILSFNSTDHEPSVLPAPGHETSDSTQSTYKIQLLKDRTTFEWDCGEGDPKEGIAIVGDEDIEVVVEDETDPILLVLGVSRRPVLIIVCFPESAVLRVLSSRATSTRSEAVSDLTIVTLRTICRL